MVERGGLRRGEEPTRIELETQGVAAGCAEARPAQHGEDPLVGTRLGNFVIDRPLARGGMAVVYVARHPELGREVAVKLLSEDYRYDRDLNRRFLQEARVMSALRHAHVVEILDFGTIEGRSYYTMELLEGMDLSCKLKEHGRFHHQLLSRYFVQVAAALDAAHAQGIVHRDLKPANVFVVQDEPLELKLMDFGIAKLTEGRQSLDTRRGEVLGTPAYMAPEQAVGKVEAISVATDVYSLGVIAFEMLSGRLPFVAETEFLLLTMHVRDAPPSLAELAPDVPPRIAQLVAQCLAKDPTQRPASAGVLAEALASISASGESTELVEPLVTAGSTSRSTGRRSAPPTAPGPLLSEVERDPRTVPGPVTLAAEDTRALDRVLRGMQRRADFPAFLSNVSDISRKADADGEYSAFHLSDAILKDFALTAKLLRMANTLYASRFGGKVYSVNQAVVILGFDSVRSMALGVSVYRAPGHKSGQRRKGRFDAELADASIRALISGEVARILAPEAGVEAGELAMMSAMFRTLGAQLVMEYLPDDYQKILELSETGGMTRAQAAEKVLGITLPRLGLGVAERWSLPRKLRAAISHCPLPDAKLLSEEERLAALSQFSNDLCHIVAAGDQAAWKASVQRLLARNQALLQLDDQEIVALLGSVCKAFDARYASLFGPHHRKSRFLENARALSGERPPPERPLSSPVDDAELQELGQLVTALEDGFSRRLSADELIGEAVAGLSRVLASERVLLLTQSDDRQSLGVRHAVGDDAGSIARELILPLGRGGDVFSAVLRTGKSQSIQDALGPSALRRVPRRYFEVLGSAAFAVYPCASRGYPTALLLVDADEAARLPTADRLRATKRLREMLAKIASRS